MRKNWLSVYKIPLLLSLTVAIAIVAILVIRNPFAIGFIILGSLLGTFVLDLDYIIYAFIIEPNADFSKSLQSYIKHKDFGNAFQYVQYHKNDMGEGTLNSVVFQLALAGIALFGVSAASSYLIKALILSTFANSIYRLLILYFANDYDEWFWALKNKPSKQNVVVFIVALTGVLLFCFTLL